MDDRSRSDAWIGALLVLAGFLAACGLERPNRIIEPDVVGLVSSTDYREDGAVIVAEVDGEVIDFDHTEAVELAGAGVSRGRLLLYGEDGGRTWYAALDIRETEPFAAATYSACASRSETASRPRPAWCSGPAGTSNARFSA